MALTIGIIGFGYMGRWHLKNAPKVDGVSVVAAYDINPDQVAAAGEAGLTAYDSLDAFLSDDSFNTVLVSTPNEVHCELACAALNAGKNVICEKPVAMSMSELDKMIETAEKNGRFFTVHQNRRWDLDFKTIKEVVDSGKLGNIYAIHSRLHGARGAMFGWRALPEHGGGMIYDWGVHFIDQILLMMGFDSVKSVFCKAVNVKTPAVEDYFFLVMDLKCGMHVQMEVGTFVLKPQPRWMVMGDMATAYIDDFTATGGIIGVDDTVEGEEVVIMTTSGPTRTFAPRSKQEIVNSELPKVESDLTEYYANLRDVNDGIAELLVKPEQVKKTFRIIEAAFESARTGRQIMI